MYILLGKRLSVYFIINVVSIHDHRQNNKKSKLSSCQAADVPSIHCYSFFYYIHLTGLNFKEENLNVSTQVNCDYGFRYNRASPVSVDASILCCLLKVMLTSTFQQQLCKNRF